MPSDIHAEASTKILAAIYNRVGSDGRMHAFFTGPNRFQQNIGVSIFYRREAFTRAILFIRQNGPLHLRLLSVGKVWGMLTSFIGDNYWCIARETAFKDFEGPVGDIISTEAKRAFTEALAVSAIFSPIPETTLFPLVALRVADDFESDAFYLSTPATLGKYIAKPKQELWLCPEFFPPMKDWKGKKEVPNAWLGVKSPLDELSIKAKSVILGAIALTPMPRYRHMFSMRQNFGGRCVIRAGGLSTSFGEPNMPSMMHDIVITSADHAWLALLSEKLSAGDRPTRRQMTALEYFYKAWFLDPPDRFPILCMVIDAIVGEQSQATQAVINGVRTIVGDHVDAERLGLLMRLRGSVIHGGAPNVYESSKYGKYYIEYGQDPIFDLELIVARCLTKHIFGEALQTHADPNAEILQQGQAIGRLPESLYEDTILGSMPL